MAGVEGVAPLGCRCRGRIRRRVPRQQDPCFLEALADRGDAPQQTAAGQSELGTRRGVVGPDHVCERLRVALVDRATREHGRARPEHGPRRAPHHENLEHRGDLGADSLQRDRIPYQHDGGRAANRRVGNSCATDRFHIGSLRGRGRPRIPHRVRCRDRPTTTAPERRACARLARIRHAARVARAGRARGRRCDARERVRARTARVHRRGRRRRPRRGSSRAGGATAPTRHQRDRRAAAHQPRTRAARRETPSRRWRPGSGATNLEYRLARRHPRLAPRPRRPSPRGRVRRRGRHRRQQQRGGGAARARGAGAWTARSSCRAASWSRSAAGSACPRSWPRPARRLVEVGTTNRTRLADYERALSERTALVLKVHASNYRMVGFVASTPVSELATLGPPVVVDAGLGAARRDHAVAAGAADVAARRTRRRASASRPAPRSSPSRATSCSAARRPA